MTFFFDLDGTLLDASERLFRALVPSTQLSKEAYWALKSAKVSHATILAQQHSYTPESIAAFEQAWLGLIESPAYLALDTPVTGVQEVLQQLHKHHGLCVVTARQSRVGVLSQLETLGWLPWFEHVLVTEQRYSKQTLIQQQYPQVEGDSRHWVIGDSGYDVQTGQALGLSTVAVTYGFLSRDSLLPYSPTALVDTALALLPILL
jgi:phosphoglycolate phosphatase-like HAD superfamily hydrolase